MRRTNETGVALTLREHPVPKNLLDLINRHNSYVRYYTIGQARVIVTKEFGKWHISISCKDRYPTWDEVAEARYQAIPNAATMVMVLPPKEEFINIHKYCFQLLEIEHSAIE